MMNLLPIRIILLFVMGLILTLLMIKWDLKYNSTQTLEVSQKENVQVSHSPLSSKEIPSIAPEIPQKAPTNLSDTQEQFTVFKNALYDLKINLKNGEIVETRLKKVQASLENKEPFELLYDSSSGARYVAQSGILSQALPETILYTLEQQDDQHLVLSFKTPEGLKIFKTYTNNEKDYRIDVETRIENGSAIPLSLQLYQQLLRTEEDKQKSFLTAVTTYTGAVVSTPETHYEKIKLKEISEKNLERSALGGWSAMLQHYFVSAWIPPQKEQVTYYSRFYQNRYYSIGYTTAPIQILPGQIRSETHTLYLGPALTDQLRAAAPYLDLTIDYGWLWFISDLIFDVLRLIQQVVSNWGVSIILVTCLIKLIFYPLSSKSYRSMARMRQLQPKIEQLKARIGDDKQKFSQEMMALYRDEKVNPLGGCLPILIQIPVFIGLYWVLMESIELRHAPFYGWIHDLSAMDPYYILPLLMGGSMFVQQRLSPAPPDPVQAKVMMFMPVIFTLMFLNFPSGLVLYWLVNNCLSILQQWWVSRQVQVIGVSSVRSKRK